MRRYLRASLIFISLLLILNSLAWLRSTNLYQTHLNLHIVTFESTYKGIVNTFELVSRTIAEEILQKEDITQQVHRIISTQGDKRNHARGLLYRKLSPIYERISQHSIHQIHFHFPDNRSMLRFHAPHRADDDLAPFRSSVVTANKERREVHGYESGRGAHGFRHIYPLSYKGMSVGTVEISSSFQHVCNELTKHVADGSQYQFIMLKSDFWNKIAYGLKDIYRPSALSDLYMYENEQSEKKLKTEGTLFTADQMHAFQKQLNDNPELLSGLKSEQNFTLSTRWKGKTYSVIFYSVKNVDGHHAAYIVNTLHEPYLESLKNNRLIQFFISVVFATLLTLLQMMLWRSKDRQKRTSDFLHTLTEHMGEGLYATDSHGAITYINQEASKILGYPIKEALQKNAHDLFHIEDSDHQNKDCTVLNTILKDQTYIQQASKFKARDGSEIPVELTCTPIRKKNLVTGTITLFHNISKRKKQEQELEETRQRLKRANRHLAKLAHIDGLTSVANRRLFDQTVSKLWKSAARNNSTLSLLMIDIDYFKAYNDYYGHQRGDDCLCRVAKAIQDSCFRPEDFIARYGGEEFAVLLPETTIDNACQIAERIVSNMRRQGQPHKASPINDLITVSIGVCSLRPKADENYQKLIDCADSRLYLAKQQGRNQVCHSSIKKSSRSD